MSAAVPETPVARATLLRLFQRLRGSESGAAAVEFAFVAAPFLALLIAMVQSALVFLAGRELDEVVAQASRYILTGQAQTSGMTQAQFATYVCGQTSALFNCNNFMIDVQNFPSASSVNVSPPTLTFNAQGQVTNTWTWAPGSPSSYVVVRVMYQWPVVLGPLGFNLATLGNGNRLLTSVAVFRSEPYQ